MTRVFFLSIFLATCFLGFSLTMPISRAEFNYITGSLLSFSSARVESQKGIRLGLRFLPISGCFALRTTLIREENGVDDSFTYFAIVDTGSPFLTAPPEAISQPTSFPPTNEQYGESIGNMQWRKADAVTWIGMDGNVLEANHVVLGTASPLVVQETGGIFVGLVSRDDNRPSWWQQVGTFRSFEIDFSTPSLFLSRHPLLTKDDPKAMKLFDLTSYGPDLHHYAIECEQFQLQWHNNTVLTMPTSTLDRPVIVVLDTGLTGCILSTSLEVELGTRLSEDTVYGLTVTLPTIGEQRVKLTSSQKYWKLACFSLPWFYDEEEHPHIIAVGATVWASGAVKALVVDTFHKCARVDLL